MAMAGPATRGADHTQHRAPRKGRASGRPRRRPQPRRPPSRRPGGAGRGARCGRRAADAVAGGAETGTGVSDDDGSGGRARTTTRTRPSRRSVQRTDPTDPPVDPPPTDPPPTDPPPADPPPVPPGQLAGDRPAASLARAFRRRVATRSRTRPRPPRRAGPPTPARCARRQAPHAGGPAPSRARRRPPQAPPPPSAFVRRTLTAFAPGVVDRVGEQLANKGQHQLVVAAERLGRELAPRP